jgi:hypothetical protein
MSASRGGARVDATARSLEPKTDNFSVECCARERPYLCPMHARTAWFFGRIHRVRVPIKGSSLRKSGLQKAFL